MDYVTSNDAPKAIGPYSQAIKANGFVYLSGQTPIDPATGELVKGDFDALTRRVFENLKAVLTAAGTDFSRVVKATVYLTSMSDFAAMNAIYASYFGDHRPARTTVAVAALPKGTPIEIDLIAVV